MAGRTTTERVILEQSMPDQCSGWSPAGGLWPGVTFAFIVLSLFSTSVLAERLDEMSLERWAKLREVERYQLQIAEKYYGDKDWKIAMAEYEKYLTLYEHSEAAPYCQLKWSLCLVQLRKINTAIKEGFQSVIDYWPDSPEAVAAAYYIGRSYKDMGETASARKAYQNVLLMHPHHLAAVYATVDLIDLSRIDDDVEARVACWKRLTFDTARTRDSERYCIEASQQFARYLLDKGAFNDAVKALQTTYAENELPAHVHELAVEAVNRLGGDPKTKAVAEQLADAAVGYLRNLLPETPWTPEEKNLARSYWYYMADLHAAARRDAKVPAFYQQIIDIFGLEDETLGRLAAWYKSQGRHDEARREYARVQDKVEGQRQIAISYRDQKKYEPAVLAFRQNLAIDPENRIKWNAEIADTYHNYAHKYDAAIAVYEELLKIDLDNSQKWRWQIATAYRDAGKYRQAIGHYRQCTNFPSNYREMAMCDRRLEAYQEAILLYGQIMGGAPAYAPWALLEIAYTQEQAGQKEEAISTFRQVCKQYPKDRYASQAHAHLQSKYKITVTLGGAKDE